MKLGEDGSEIRTSSRKGYTPGMGGRKFSRGAGSTGAILICLFVTVICNPPPEIASTQQAAATTATFKVALGASALTNVANDRFNF